MPKGRHAARRTGWVRGLLAVGATVSVLAGPASAAYTDQARTNLGAQGIGSQTFDIGVVTTDLVFRQATSAGSVLVPVVGEDLLVPGRSVSLDVRIASNTVYPATLTLAVRAGGAAADGAVAGTPNITPFLRFSAQDTSTGAYLFGGATPAAAVPLAAAQGVTGPLAARGAPALTDGVAWTRGAAGSDRTLRVTIVFPDTPETSTYNGGRSALALAVTGTSTGAP